MSGLFKSTLIKGNRITDFTQTTATVGVVIPFGYGRFPTDGNVIFAPLPPKENRTVKRQGKGGVKQETFTYTLSYAVAFCQGPIYGYWWIKRNGKVVWTNDPNAPIEDQAYAAKWAQKATFYYGTSSQLPDSTIESYKGSGNVSAFRYLAYIVVEDDDVTDGGGAVPSYEAVPIASPPELYLTSKPYAQKFADNAELLLRPAGGFMEEVVVHGEMDSDDSELDFQPVGGKLFEVRPPAEVDAAELSFTPTVGELAFPPLAEGLSEAELTFAPTTGELKLPPKGDLFSEPELLFAPLDGELETVIIVADTTWDPAAKHSTVTLGSGDMTAEVAGATYRSVYATDGKSSGKWQFELQITGLPASQSNGPYLGIADKTNSASLLPSAGPNYVETITRYTGQNIQVKLTGDTATVTAASYLALNDVVTVTLDLDASPQVAKFYKNGTLEMTRNLPSGKTWYPFASIRRSSVVLIVPISLNYPQSGFTDWG